MDADIPEGYNPDRERKTWSEGHPLTKEQRERREKRTDAKRANRELRRFGKVNWEYYRHDELYNMIMTADVETMARRAGDWRKLAEGIEATTTQVQNIMRDVMTSWKGSAAVAAAQANTRLTQWAGDASHTATQVAAGMADYTEAVEVAQHRMPPPTFATAERNFRDGWTISTTGMPSDAVLIDRLATDYMVSHEKARAEKAEAVRVMEDYEQSSRQVHDTLPDFTPAAQSGINPNVDEGLRPPPVQTPPNQGPPTQDNTGGGTTSAGFTDPSLGPGDNSQGSGRGPTGPGTGLPNTGADSTRGGLGPGSGPGGAFAGAPGGRGGAVGGGVGGGGGGRGGVGGAGPLAARGVPGGAPGAAGLAGARGVGGPGGAGTGGLYPPLGAAGALGDEDSDHKNKYGEGLDLFDDLPPAYPPVFGA